MRPLVDRRNAFRARRDANGVVIVQVFANSRQVIDDADTGLLQQRPRSAAYPPALVDVTLEEACAFLARTVIVRIARDAHLGRTLAAAVRPIRRRILWRQRSFRLLLIQDLASTRSAAAQ